MTHFELHECVACCDGGRIALGHTPSHQDFGRTMLCRFCSGAGVGERESDERAYERMRIPIAYREASVRDLSEGLRDQVAGWLAYALPQLPFMLLEGQVGAGKTYTACALLREVYHRHAVRGQFWPTIELLERYRATFQEDEAIETSAAIDAEMRRAQVLVLDDLGKHKSTEWAEQALFRVIDERYRTRRSLIVTTNVGVGALPEAVRSRLADKGMSTVVHFAGRDRRLA